MMADGDEQQLDEKKNGEVVEEGRGGGGVSNNNKHFLFETRAYDVTNNITLIYNPYSYKTETDDWGRNDSA